MRPPVTMPLEETIMQGKRESLIFLDSCEVEVNVTLGQVSGDPYWLLRRLVSSLYSSVCFRKTCTAVIAIGLSQKMGILGIWPASINSFNMKINFCVRSMAKAGTITLPPRSTVWRMAAASFGRGSSVG